MQKRLACAVAMPFSHLSSVCSHLQNLGNFGPLKCKEIYSLDKLKRQADIIEHLIALAKTGPHVADLHSGEHPSPLVQCKSFPRTIHTFRSEVGST